MSIINFFKLLRIHQWSKNILIFLPAIFAHELFLNNNYNKLFIVFILLSLTASSIYIFNDIIDLEKDQKHKYKSLRPIASKLISVRVAFFTALSFMLVALAFSYFIDINLVYLLLIYIFANILYSYIFKNILIFDCFLLSLFYVFRISIGGILTDIYLSFWLLSFSFFAFLSLSFLKRFADINLLSQDNKDLRIYKVEHLNLIRIFGINSFYISAIILILYFNSNNILELYSFHYLLWIIVIFYFLYMHRIWIVFNSISLDDDIVKYVITDPLLYIIAFISILILIFSI